MVKIIEKDGIPCINIENNTLLTKEGLKIESRKIQMPDIFSLLQNSKEINYFNKVREELKKKFGEE